MIRFLSIMAMLLACIPAQAQTRSVRINSLNISNGKTAFLLEVDGASHVVADDPQIFLDGVPVSIGTIVDIMVDRELPEFEIDQDPMRYGTVAVIRAKTVASEAKASPVSGPVYETVNVTTYETICENGVCRRVPIVSQVRRLVSDVATVATVFAPSISVGSPAPGNHQHTDPKTGEVWEHGNENVGNYEAHLSPFTGTYVTERSACSGYGSGYGSSFRSGGGFFRSGFQGFRSRFGLRRQGRFTKLQNYSATGERSFPLISALAPKNLIGLTL